jgi:hypothetical protein
MSLSLVHKYPEYGAGILLRNAGTYPPENTDVKSQKILNLTRSHVNRTYVTNSRILSVTGKVDFKQRCSYPGHDQLQNTGITTAQLHLQHSVK